MNDEAMLAQERKEFHEDLIRRKVMGFTIKKLKGKDTEVASNADISQTASRKIADKILHLVLNKTDTDMTDAMAPLSGQTLGKEFEKAVCRFVQRTFPNLQALRPGNWEVQQLGNQSTIKEASFSQYEHLSIIDKIVNGDPDLKAALGNDYVVAPDVVVSRGLYTDKELNESMILVNSEVACNADLRAKTPQGDPKRPILHASISAKWTMRSDRAQNSRTEALNLIRNRKGQLPHVVVVTGEPLPSRIASLALGTGDIDCTYHAFLYELIQAVDDMKDREDLAELVHTLVDGKRLKDISDLPLDLAV